MLLALRFSGLRSLSQMAKKTSGSTLTEALAYFYCLLQNLQQIAKKNILPYKGKKGITYLSFLGVLKHIVALEATSRTTLA